MAFRFTFANNGFAEVICTYGSFWVIFGYFDLMHGLFVFGFLAFCVLCFVALTSYLWFDVLVLGLLY